ncbi:shikimate kinase [Xenophilus sp. Marseille-Q4582]|uniref:shikimate kinase n=1 Tax=Xenophilus sp. Marseille-Q4582 TaxID=2866600 RepID=UPI001CE4B38E|nr:shikimate kinase [Xenophilus sp. Marseille-Q4582]
MPELSTPPVSVALVGMPGSGKSALGRRLAQRLGWPFVDLDQVIEERAGCTIRELFEREGEAYFRDMEQRVIAEYSCGAVASVIATGGGAVLRPENRDMLRAGPQVIYLWSSPEALYRRLRHDVKRPLLQVADPLARLRSLYDARDPLYREVAGAVVDTGHASVTVLTRILHDLLVELGVVRAPAPPAAEAPVPAPRG